jgi:hypothetical protein
MALKIWLIRKIEELQLEIKYLNALLIMLQHVEQATDYSDSDSDSKQKERDSEDSIRTDDIEALTDSDDEEQQQKMKEELLSKIKKIQNKKF